MFGNQLAYMGNSSFEKTEKLESGIFFFLLLLNLLDIKSVILLRECR